MKNYRNLLVISLMTASIILLLVLEILWLKNAYRDERSNFTRNTYFLFQNTVMLMQDSIIRKDSVPINAETNFNALPDIGVPPKDDLRTKRLKPESIFKIIRPVISILSSRRFPDTFMVKITGDSVNLSNLNQQFNEELKKAGIDIPFKTTVSDGKDIYSSWVYSVHFENMGLFAFERLMPQVLFCTTLTLLILISFYSMYLNIRANQRLMEIKNDFISHVTHELKTPVATVTVAIEAIKNFNVLKDPDKAMQYLEIADREIKRLDLLTEKILTKTVIEQKGIKLKNEKVDIKKLTLDVLDTMKLVFEKRNAAVSFNDSGREYIVNGSHEHLTETVYNLMDNALKYGQPGVKIDVNLKSDGRYVMLSVKDNGPGILPEYHKKVFEKFTRVPVGDAYNSRGYGLGLHYVKQVVEGHRGKIALESKPGLGCTFIIRIPAAHE